MGWSRGEHLGAREVLQLEGGSDLTPCLLPMRFTPSFIFQRWFVEPLPSTLTSPVRN